MNSNKMLQAIEQHAVACQKLSWHQPGGCIRGTVHPAFDNYNGQAAGQSRPMGQPDQQPADSLKG